MKQDDEAQLRRCPACNSSHCWCGSDSILLSPLQEESVNNALQRCRCYSSLAAGIIHHYVRQRCFHFHPVFVQEDIDKANERLRKRALEILEANPWLGGHFEKENGVICLVYEQNKGATKIKISSCGVFRID